MLARLASLDTAVGEVADLLPAPLSTDDKRDALLQLARVTTRLAELRLRVLAASGEVGAEVGARNTAAWLAHATRTDVRTTRADARLADRLEAHPAVAAGMRAGVVNVEQARVVTAVLDDLPGDVPATTRASAEATLVEHCADFNPRDLRRLGNRLIEVIAPDVIEAVEGDRLEAEERRAHERASLRFADLGDGRSRVWGTLPTPVVQRWKHYLNAFTSPRHHPAPTDPLDSQPGALGERVPQHRAYAHAFAALLEAIDPDQLPEQAGDATTVVVTLDYDKLCADLATADVIAGDGETPISAAQARRLACQATILPAVLGSRGEVLDLGRGRRFHNRAQRRAVRLRDRRCRAEGCSIPAAWTEVHHRQPWSKGGTTNVDDALSLCSHHHHRVHDRAYRAERLPNGDLRFHRRT